MPYITVGKENHIDIKIHYEDHGTGKPIVLIHGFPLSGAAWEKQVAVLLKAGHRVVTYDRRGFGLSSQPSIGYNYDTLADDLHTLITQLDLRDVTLVGHSMGTGEITRYLGTFGSKLISRAVLIAPIPPFLLKTKDNQTGVDSSVFEGMKAAIVKDRPAFIAEFFKNFYNTDKNLGTLVSKERIQVDFNLGTSASAIGTLACVSAWLTDFRRDLPKIDIPCLIIQGGADRILPIEATGTILAKLIKARLVKIPDGPHAVAWTHSDLVNKEILNFLSEGALTQSSQIKDDVPLQSEK
ncbi:MAG: alpha/beta hydrolase [Bacteriovorax sp.]|nr:alpha/beta hydrolase [Bacteriovorax sp.]